MDSKYHRKGRALESHYEMHCDLFKHYSSTLFRARLSIIGAILLIFSFLLSFDGTQSEAVVSIYGVSSTAIIAFIAAIAIALLYSMETAYIRRLSEVAASASKSTSDGLPFAFFGSYRPLWHWPLLALYYCAVLILISIFWMHKPIEAGGICTAVFAIAAAAPVALLAYTTKRHKEELDQRGKEGLAAENKMDRQR